MSYRVLKFGGSSVASATAMSRVLDIVEKEAQKGTVILVSSAISGVALFELLKAALQYLGVDANAQYIFIGLVIFVAISLDIRKYVAKK